VGVGLLVGAAAGAAPQARELELDESDAPKSDLCEEARLVSFLARAEGSSDEDLKMIRAVQGALCAGVDEDAGKDVIRYSNGQWARYTDGHWYYPNGRWARYTDGHWYYPSGQWARYTDGHWYYPNGNWALYPDGTYYRPGGGSTTVTELLAAVCEGDEDRCEAATAAYKATSPALRPGVLFAFVWLDYKAKNP
jgi:hypothetical protein